MNAEAQQEEHGHPADRKIDDLIAKLTALSSQVDEVAESLTRSDAEAVRRAFKAKEGTGDV